MEDQERTDSDFSFTLWIRGMFSLPLFPVLLMGVMYNVGQSGRTDPVLGSQNSLKPIPIRIQF